MRFPHAEVSRPAQRVGLSRSLECAGPTPRFETNSRPARGGVLRMRRSEMFRPNGLKKAAAALIAGAALSAATIGAAQADGWGYGHRHHGGWGDRGWGGGGAVVVGPGYYYAPPPPVYYAP